MDLLHQWASFPAAADRVLSIVGITIHWSILQYVLGLPLMALIAEIIYLATGREKWRRLAITLSKGFIVVFAVGAAMGTAVEFGLVLIWPNLVEAAGRYIYFPLYAEIFAFMMEVAFIYMLWVGWRKLPPKAHVVVTFLAMAGAWFSAAMIVSVNSYMVAPTGIQPAYDPARGWLFSQGYPKIALYVPKSIVPVLDVGKLAKLGMEVKGATDDSVIVWMPSRIVGRLAYEAWSGYAVKDSILKLVVKPEAVSPELLSTPVKSIVDAILVSTIRHEGVYMVTFLSPVYAASILHTLGSAIVVSSFTVMAGYALRLLREARGEEYRDYVETGFRYAAVIALIAIAVQGLVLGDLMGKAVARYNPEKFAAMEGTSKSIASLSELLGTRSLMGFLAYGSFSAPLPDYDKIPASYCQCLAAPDPAIRSCRPPLLIHYVYYTKVGLGILLGIYALILFFYAARKRMPPRFLLVLAPLAALLTEVVSNMGWYTREIGRKPWTIYGVMTVDVAHTVNPPTVAQVAVVSVYMVAILAALVFAVWRFLWVPGREVE